MDTFWSADETNLLLDMYKKYEYLIYLKNNKFWKIIAKSLQDSGSRKEANDCKKKMDNLKAAYKTC